MKLSLCSGQISRKASVTITKPQRHFVIKRERKHQSVHCFLVTTVWSLCNLSLYYVYLNQLIKPSRTFLRVCIKVVPDKRSLSVLSFIRRNRVSSVENLKNTITNVVIWRRKHNYKCRHLKGLFTSSWNVFVTWVFATNSNFLIPIYLQPGVQTMNSVRSNCLSLKYHKVYFIRLKR